MTEKQRLFFALWPSPEQQALLATWGVQLQKTLGGRLTRTASVHLTLVFIGDVAESALESVLRIGQAHNAQPIELSIDQTGYWRHNGIAWAAPRVTPPALSALVSSLESALRAAGFDVESRTYRPHITLLRRAFGSAVNWQPTSFVWRPDRFVLVRSQRSASGADYQRLAEWPLNATINCGD